MKKILFIIASIVVIGCMAASCASKLEDTERNPYAAGTKVVNICLTYPEGATKATEPVPIAGATVKVINSTTGVEYQLLTDSEGKCSIALLFGVYKLTASYKGVSEAGVIPIYNVSLGELKVTEDKAAPETPLEIALQMEASYTNQLVIKEFYFSGCLNTDGKNYIPDSYFSIYNNSSDVAYLDSVCFGCADAYNSTAKPTGWERTDAAGNKIIRDTIPITEAVWQFKGDGTTYALQPGEEAIVAFRGGIDHTKVNPNSIDLSKPEYFLCYDTRYTNKTYHPAPAPTLPAEHWLNLLWKQGKANAYPLSQLCPTALIFKIKGTSAKEYINNPNNVTRKPGSSGATTYVQVPASWVIDGVEVMRTDKEYKRLPTSVDASYALWPASTPKGKSLLRKIDEEATASSGGRVIYQDTNNSGADFKMIDHPTLKQ